MSVGIEDRVIRIDSRASLADYRDLLLRFYPGSAAGIDRIMALIARIMKDMDVLYGIDNPLFKDVLRDRAYLFGTLARAVTARRAELEASSGSDSVLSLFLSVDEPPDAFRAVSEGHLFYAPTPAGWAITTRGAWRRCWRATPENRCPRDP